MTTEHTPLRDLPEKWRERASKFKAEANRLGSSGLAQYVEATTYAEVAEQLEVALPPLGIGIDLAERLDLRTQLNVARERILLAERLAATLGKVEDFAGANPWVGLSDAHGYDGHKTLLAELHEALTLWRAKDIG